MSNIDHLPLKILLLQGQATAVAYPWLLLQLILASPQIWDLPIFHTVIVTIVTPFCALGMLQVQTCAAGSLQAYCASL